jgi:hypothetical protein
MTLTISRRLLLGSLMVALAAATAVGGFLYGRSTKDTVAARRSGHAAGFNAGHAAGLQEGRSAALASYSPGNPGYRVIYKKGYSSGERAGYKTGQSVGNDLGRVRGETTGENNAFEGYPGGWEIGRWYIIKIGSGSQVGSNARYSIPTRVGPMDYSQTYNLCAAGGGICGSG